MIDSQRKNARQRREIHLAREMRKAEATMKCPNCHGTDIDFTFSPPRCRFCNPVMTGFEKLLKEALDRANAKVAELEAERTTHLQALNAAYDVIASTVDDEVPPTVEVGRALSLLLDILNPQVRIAHAGDQTGGDNDYRNP